MCSNASREMISIEDRYFNLNRILLLIIGLWPYQKSAFTRFQSICFFSIEAILIISQFTIFLTSKFTIDIVIKILSPAFACISFTLTYNSFYINDKTVIYLMKQLQLIYDDIKDNNEFMIIEKYGNNAKYYTISLITSFFFIICVHISAPIWSDFFDVILTADKFRQRHIQTNFVKQKQYSQQYLRQLYINVAIYVGIAAVVATGTMLITYFQHFCGLFRIASYRIQNAMQNYISQDINLQKESLIHKDIIYAIDIHRKAMKFSNYLTSKLEKSVLLLIIFGVITLSSNIFHVASSGYNFERFLLPIYIVVVCTLYMFLSNFVGQEIIDHNNDVYAAAYNVCWYTAPLHVQKLIMFLLQRGNKTFGLSISGLFIASLECFATLIKTSVSYFTVMYSVR